MVLYENGSAKNVFHFFEEIARIPRGSGNTGKIADYLVSFASERGLRHYRDEKDNVVIWKPAAKGYEKNPAVILQGHTDMVAESTSTPTEIFSVRTARRSAEMTEYSSPTLSPCSTVRTHSILR